MWYEVCKLWKDHCEEDPVVPCERGGLGLGFIGMVLRGATLYVDQGLELHCGVCAKCDLSG